MIVRAAIPQYAAAIADIYNHHIQTSVTTFEEAPVAAAEMAGRMAEVWSKSLLWLVAEEEGGLMGYAYAAPWKTRSAYRFAVEIPTYIAHTDTGRGAGSKLCGELIRLLQARNVHAAMGGVALSNDASVALLEKLGFRKVAHSREVGFKFDRWIDVAYWQRIL